MGHATFGVLAWATGVFQLSGQGLEAKLCSCQKPPTIDHEEPLSNSRVWRCSPWLGCIGGDVWSARIALENEG